MNLNMLFDKLTNFKIKFTMRSTPTEVQVSNLPIIFITKDISFTIGDITLNCAGDRVLINLKEV